MATSNETSKKNFETKNQKKNNQQQKTNNRGNMW